MSEQQTPEARKEFRLQLKTKKDLYAAYMPFVKEGGLFIRSAEKVQLGDQVQLSLSLLDGAEVFNLVGKVVWINPQYTQGNVAEGFGLQFIEGDAKQLKAVIETHLAGFNQTEPTDTM